MLSRWVPEWYIDGGTIYRSRPERVHRPAPARAHPTAPWVHRTPGPAACSGVSLLSSGLKALICPGLGGPEGPEREGGDERGLPLKGPLERPCNRPF